MAEQDTTDVVYKLGSGSEHNNAELRYSLRSLQNFTSLRQVYVVGFLPEWLNTEEVEHIPAIDPYKNNKDANLIGKLILATTRFGLSSQFINMSDDQVFLEQCNYDYLKTPFVNNKHVIPEGGNARPNRWQIRINQTIQALKERNLPFDCFEAHTPYLLNKHDYAQTLFQYNYGEGKGYVGNTLYYNTLRVKGRELETNTLARIVDPIEDRTALESLCNGRVFLNYTDKAINNNLLLYLQRRLPVKSRYEK